VFPSHSTRLPAPRPHPAGAFGRWPSPAGRRAKASLADRLREIGFRVLEFRVAVSAEHPNVFGILMETGYPKAAATLAVFAEGSTSLYFSSGGGIIGAGQHESVRKTHGRFFAEAEAYRRAFTPATDTPLPAVGRVRFYLRTFGGTLTAEAPEEDLVHMRPPAVSAISRRSRGNCRCTRGEQSVGLCTTTFGAWLVRVG
jgi:hypothetical protein